MADQPVPLGEGPVFDLIRAVLVDDLTHARTAFLERDSPSSRRAYLRAYVIAVETMIHVLKSMVVNRCASGMQVSQEEFAVLTEHTAELQNNGVVKRRRLHFKTGPSLLFTLRLYARAFGLDLHVDAGGRGYQSLTSVVAVRNRLTHPKTPADLDVTPQDLSVALHSNQWLVEVWDAIQAQHRGPESATQTP